MSRNLRITVEFTLFALALVAIALIAWLWIDEYPYTMNELYRITH